MEQKDFFQYVDKLQKKYYEINKNIEIKEKIKKEEEMKICKLQDEIKKNNEILNIYNTNINQETYYLKFNREIILQKNKLNKLKDLLYELSNDKENENTNFNDFKIESYEKINKLIDNYEFNENSNTFECILNKLNEIKIQSKELNKCILETNDEIHILNKEYINFENEFKNIIELEKQMKKKREKIFIILEFIEFLKNNEENNENLYELKKKLENINI